ncbi:MAG: FAD-dependent oxidoreductase [Kiritimatiellae bacterium]|nr:FAD-dependent oxidoreductase [Kiritimatiellia bacterium]
MKQPISRRNLLKNLGIGGVAGLSLAATRGFADQATDGDPERAGFASRINKIGKTTVDPPSPYMEDGKVIQPARELPVFHQADVVVVGGGASGFAAAVAAARTGAKTALVERRGSLGGLWTNGIVLVVIGTSVRESSGEYKLVTRGICEEFLQRLEKMGPNAITSKGRNGYQPTVDPEAAKVLMDEMIQEAGVDMFFHAWGVDVIKTGSALQGVIFESKEGRQAIIAKNVVDASGDGDIYHHAGADYEQISHGMGFVYRIGNVDRIDGSKAPKDKKFNLGSSEPLKSTRWVNNLGPRGNGLDVREISKIEMMHRQSAWNYVERMRQTPGYEDVFLLSTCTEIGVRATRLLDGVKKISKKAAIINTKYDDTVAVSGDDSFKHPEFAIPYGSLLPKEIDNLIVAGRCISVAPDLIDRVRLIPVCVVTGQAAGVAAALAAKGDVTSRNLPIQELQRVLKSQGAYLG